MRRDGLTWREFEGDTILLDLTNSRYLRVNGSGSELLAGLAEGESQGQLVGRLVNRFGVDEAAAASDVETFLARLDEVGLLERS